MQVFFILSAFLIVTLLLREKEARGTIDLKAFAMRRVLRIWPLYFLLIFICFGLGKIWSSAQLSAHAILAFSLLAGNFYLLRNDLLPSPINPLWSISVEEQFYVCIPLLARVSSRRTLSMIFIATIAVSYAVLCWIGLRPSNPTFATWINSFVQFQFFAAGGLLALYYARPRKPLKGSTRLALAIFGFGLWAFAMAVCDFSVIFKPTPIPKLVFGYMSILLGTLSIFVAVLDIECRIPKPFLYLGKISYGLYLFHELFLWLIFRNLQNTPRMQIFADHKWFAIPLAFAATVATASVSYAFFEKPILAFKGRFEAIRTRPL